MERMSDERWVKRVAKWSGGQSKWMKGCWRNARMHGCQKVWRVQLNMNVEEWRMVDERGSGTEWDLSEWKKWIDKRVKEVGVRKWREGMHVKPTLAWYERKECPRHEWCYDGSFGSQLLFKARTQSLEVNARTYRWSESGVRMCEQCDRGVDESVLHVVLECERYDRERQRLLDSVVQLVGQDEWLRVSSMDDRGMCLLLGLGEGCLNVTEMVKMFLVKVWTERMMNARHPVIP